MSETGRQTDDSSALDRAREMLRKVFGHDDFRAGQPEVIASAMAGRNLLVVMPTGSGKSLLYQLPALLADGLTLVVSPLIALMKDQVDELQRHGVAAAFINSSLSPDQQRDTIDQCVAGRIRLLYVAPERFRASSFLRMLEQVTIARLAVDEAHCISEWGHDFRPDYRRIKQFRQQMGEPVVTALTATATPQVQQDIIAALGLEPADIEVHVRGFDRPNLKLNVVRTRNDNEKIAYLRDFIRAEKGAGIIYVGTRRAAEDLTAELRPIEPSVTMYHAGLDGDQRAHAQEVFLAGKARIAVATVAFGMGIDKADVRFVAHYHFPGSIEQYYQEIGRAGRDGKPSDCVLLYNSGDRFLRQFFIDLSYPTREQVGDVMDTLFEINANPVMLTHKQIAERCSEPVKDGQVGAAIRLLASAGVARPLEGTASALVTLHQPGATIAAGLRGKVQKSVFEALAIAGDLEDPGEMDVDLNQLAAAASLTVQQVQRSLTALDDAGHIDYHPPFRGRGVQKLIDTPPPFDRVDIDWTTQDFLRSLEEEKLERMEAYIHAGSCRRAFIVSYFGEQSDMICGECDRCRRAGQTASGGQGAGVLQREPQVAGAVLACVQALRFPLGVTRTAQVVTGSRDSKLREWGLNTNPAYGAAHCSQDKAKDVIDQLTAERYLSRAGEYDRPVLELTDTGRLAAESIDVEALGQSQQPASTASPRSDGAPIKQTDLTRAALQCVAAVETSIGVSRVAEVLTGSNAKWIAPAGADRLSMYNCTRMSQSDARDHIRRMIADNLLKQTANGRYPVLEITAAGRNILEEGDENDDTPVQSAKLDLTTEPPAPKPATLPTPTPETRRNEDGAALLGAMLTNLTTVDRPDVPSAAEKLRLFHPVHIAAALADMYRSTDDQRIQARLLWAAGELCDGDATELLLGAAGSDAPLLRRQAAGALGKIAARTCEGAVKINRRMPTLHESLQRLLDDDDDGVREAAQKAVSELTGQQPPVG